MSPSLSLIFRVAGLGSRMKSDLLEVLHPLASALRVGAALEPDAVITTDVPAGALALGRARQENKPGRARDLVARLKAKKAAKAGKEG